MSRRINQFFVGRCEQRDGGREGHVGSNELLEDRGIIRHRKSQVVKCGFETPNCRRRCRDHTVSPAKRLSPPRSKDLSLALHLRKAEGRFPCRPHARGGGKAFPVVNLVQEVLGHEDGC
jgi:hypothetical protein